jgi:hypothetical protein
MTMAQTLGLILANRAVVQPLHGFNVRLLMMTLQADANLEVFLLRLGSGELGLPYRQRNFPA